MSKRAKDAINDIKHLTEIQGSDHAPILLDLDVLFTDDELVEEWKKLTGFWQKKFWNNISKH